MTRKWLGLAGIICRSFLTWALFTRSESRFERLNDRRLQQFNLKFSLLELTVPVTSRAFQFSWNRPSWHFKPENILLRPWVPSHINLIDFGIARRLSAKPIQYNLIKTRNNLNVVCTLNWCSIKVYLGFGKSNSILFCKWVVMQIDLRPHDGLKSPAYVLLYLLMGDFPWRIYAPYESTKNAKMRFLTSRLGFTGSTNPAVISVNKGATHLTARLR